MACYAKCAKETTVTIPNYLDINGTTFYEIQVKVGTVQWMVQRRFKEFVDLNDKLVSGHSISKDLRPPKKVLGNRSAAFLEQRQMQLQTYLQTVLKFLQYSMCREFVEFLHFNNYDIVYLLQDMAQLFYLNGDTMLATYNRHASFSALELYGISERLKLPCPPLENTGTSVVDSHGDDITKQYDFSHVLDYCSQLNSILVEIRKKTGQTIDGSPSTATTTTTTSSTIEQDLTIGTSNIVPSNLKFNFNAFQTLKRLTINGLSPENISDAASIRETVTHLTVHNSLITQINQMLLCDCVHKSTVDIKPISLTTIESSTSADSNHKNGVGDIDDDDDDDDVVDNIQISDLDKKKISVENDYQEKIWKNLLELDLSQNSLTIIDSSISLLPNLEKLKLDRNRIKQISYLNYLPRLSYLSLCENYLTQCLDCHLELGNIRTLILSQNKLRSLIGFRKMYSLVTLNVSCNLIATVDEVDHISGLPCLEELILTGNPVASTVDYRQRVLSRFGDRCTELFLDNERADSLEIDMALVLAALRQSESPPQLKNILS